MIRLKRILYVLFQTVLAYGRDAKYYLKHATLAPHTCCTEKALQAQLALYSHTL